MPNKCVVPGCRSNYESQGVAAYVPAFKFPPENSALWLKWVNNIPRRNWRPTKYSVVCRKHFQDSDIVDYEVFRDRYGVVQKVERSKIVLKDGACPTLFPSLAAHKSSEPMKEKKTHAQLSPEIDADDDAVENNISGVDLIHNFETFCLNYEGHVNASNNEGWRTIHIKDKLFLFYKVSVETIPKISVSISVLPDLHINVHIDQKFLDIKSFRSLLINGKLTRWSHLTTLLSHFKDETGHMISAHSISGTTDNYIFNFSDRNGKEQTNEQRRPGLKEEAFPALFPSTLAVGETNRYGPSVSNTDILPSALEIKQELDIETQHSRQTHSNVGDTEITPLIQDIKQEPYIENNFDVNNEATCTQAGEIHNGDEGNYVQSCAGQIQRLLCGAGGGSQTEKRPEQARDEEFNFEANNYDINNEATCTQAEEIHNGDEGSHVQSCAGQNHKLIPGVTYGPQYQKKPDHVEASNSTLLGSSLNTVSNSVMKSLKSCGDTPTKCDICDASFVECSCLKSNQRTHSVEKRYKCDICACTFSLSDHLLQHKNIHVEKKLHMCHFCGASFYYSSSLKLHTSKTENNPCRCDICGVAFLRLNCLRLHQQIHSGSKNYKCDICGDAFMTDAAAFKHKKREHVHEKLFLCETCGQAFKHALSLSHHQRRHTGEIPYTCEICEKAYKNWRALKLHKQIHTGQKREKPFLCNICGAAFALFYRLKVHIRRHAGTKPYKCSICPASFADNSDLYRHTKQHTGERRHRCDICGASFTRLHNLRTHKYKHIKKTSVQL